jgi:hypothetical protein
MDSTAHSSVQWCIECLFVLDMLQVNRIAIKVETRHQLRAQMRVVNGQGCRINLVDYVVRWR